MTKRGKKAYNQKYYRDHKEGLNKRNRNKLESERKSTTALTKDEINLILAETAARSDPATSYTRRDLGQMGPEKFSQAVNDIISGKAGGAW